jgi:hypothetical protein
MDAEPAAEHHLAAAMKVYHRGRGEPLGQLEVEAPEAQQFYEYKLEKRVDNGNQVFEFFKHVSLPSETE